MELATPSLRARSLTEAGRPKVARRPGFARAASVSERARSLIKALIKSGVIMVIAVSCVKLLSAHNSTQHTSRKHKV